MDNNQDTMFSGRGFELTQEEILEIKDNINTIINQPYRPSFKWQIKDLAIKNYFMTLLNDICFYKNIGTLQSCPTEIFLEKVVTFIDNNNIRFWDCADWMHQYLIDAREQFETYHEFECYSELELLQEINSVVNENLGFIYEGRR